MTYICHSRDRLRRGRTRFSISLKWIMACTKQMARKVQKGLPKAVGRDLAKKDEAEKKMKGVGGGGGRKPKPVIKQGRVNKRKPDAPVKQVTMEDQIRKAQQKVDLSFIKAYFAK